MCIVFISFLSFLIYFSREIKGAQFLQRTPGIDNDAIVDTLLRVSQLAVDFPVIQELDINPLMVYGPSEGAAGVDMRLELTK
jgi:acetyltransferase